MRLIEKCLSELVFFVLIFLILPVDIANKEFLERISRYVLPMPATSELGKAPERNYHNVLMKKIEYRHIVTHSSGIE
jgi:hypothetical protein